MEGFGLKRTLNLNLCHEQGHFQPLQAAPNLALDTTGMGHPWKIHSSASLPSEGGILTPKFHLTLLSEQSEVISPLSCHWRCGNAACSSSFPATFPSGVSHRKPSEGTLRSSPALPPGRFWVTKETPERIPRNEVNEGTGKGGIPPGIHVEPLGETRSNRSPAAGRAAPRLPRGSPCAFTSS